MPFRFYEVRTPAKTARSTLAERAGGRSTRTRPDCVVPMLVRSRAARCLVRSALNPPRRQLCGGDFALKNAFVTMQLHPGATTKQIKAKFYELAKATHPYATQGSNRVSERTRCVTPTKPSRRNAERMRCLSSCRQLQQLPDE